MVICSKPINITVITSINVLLRPSNERLSDFSKWPGRSVCIRMGDRNAGKNDIEGFEKLLCPDASCDNHFVGFQNSEISRDVEVTADAIGGKRGDLYSHNQGTFCLCFRLVELGDRGCIGRAIRAEEQSLRLSILSVEMRCQCRCFLGRDNFCWKPSGMCKVSSMMKFCNASFGARNLKTTNTLEST